MIDYVFILAGGSGTRLWPASTLAKPKQFFSLYGEESLLQMSLQRAEALKPRDGIVIITLEEQLSALEEALEEERSMETPIRILPEPCARNTAPALGSAAVWAEARRRGNSPVILVVTADHLIEPVERFSGDVEKAANLAEEGHLVTFGIPPIRPETGYGYIELGKPIGAGRKVASFREKPDAETARAFLNAGDFLWNSGRFCFTAADYLEELSSYAPEVYSPLASLLDSMPPDSPREGHSLVMAGAAVRAVYETLPSISIDYAVMEKSKKAAVVEASFSWNDIGSWDVVADLLSGREPQKGVYSVDSSNNFVYSDLPVALCGVEDLIIAVKNGVLLVCRKGESQKVKSVIGEIKQQGDMDIL